MRVKTSELTDTALDWAVAKCEGVALLDPHNNEWELCWTLLADNSGDYYAPSTDWAQAGPIIEREISQLQDLGDGPWEARGYSSTGYGPTPLIAAMRTFVASKLGNEVDIPDDLVSTQSNVETPSGAAQPRESAG